MLKLNKSNIEKIKHIKRQGMEVRIIDGQPNSGWGGWIGLVFDDKGFSGTVGAWTRGYPYTNLGNLFNKALQCYAFGSRPNKICATLIVLRTNSKSTLWLKDILESLVQAY